MNNGWGWSPSVVHLLCAQNTVPSQRQIGRKNSLIQDVPKILQSRRHLFCALEECLQKPPSQKWGPALLVSLTLLGWVPCRLPETWGGVQPAAGPVRLKSRDQGWGGGEHRLRHNPCPNCEPGIGHRVVMGMGTAVHRVGAGSESQPPGPRW